MLVLWFLNSFNNIKNIFSEIVRIQMHVEVGIKTKADDPIKTICR